MFFLSLLYLWFEYGLELLKGCVTSKLYTINIQIIYILQRLLNIGRIFQNCLLQNETTRNEVLFTYGHYWWEPKLKYFQTGI